MLEIRSFLGGAARAAQRDEVFIKSEPAEETHLFASDWPPMSTNPELPIGGQDATSRQAAFARPFGQTGGTKRVRFAPVTKYDEGDVEYICGING